MTEKEIVAYYHRIIGVSDDHSCDVLFELIKEIYFDGVLDGSMDSTVRDEAIAYFALRQSNDTSFGGRVAPSGGTNDSQNI